MSEGGKVFCYGLSSCACRVKYCGREDTQVTFGGLVRPLCADFKLDKGLERISGGN